MRGYLKSAALVMAGLAAGVVFAQPKVKPDKRAILEELRRISAPVPEHQNLAPLVGRFAETIDYHAGAGEPVSLSGEAEGKWVLGGRFVQVNAHSLTSEEVAFESIGYFGYDTHKQKYFAIGLDTGGTYPIYAEGDYDAANKTWRLFGETSEPGLGGDGGQVPFKFLIRVLPDGSISHEVLFKMADSAKYEDVARTMFHKR